MHSTSTMGRYDYDKSKLDPMDNLRDMKSLATVAAASSVTLPRHHATTNTASSKMSSGGGKCMDTLNRTKGFEVTVLSTSTSSPTPPQKPLRPSTLPYRNSMGNLPKQTSPQDVDSNPLRILRDKNYPIVRPRIKIHTNNNNVDNNSQCTTSNSSSFGLCGKDAAVDNDDTCESPSYVTHPQYSFSDRDVNLHRSQVQKQIGNKEIENLNPIPLPPRDRNKVMQTNVKRHVRKYPLIIPVTGLQRQLNKVQSPVDDKSSPFAMHLAELSSTLSLTTAASQQNALLSSSESFERPHSTYINQDTLILGNSSDTINNTSLSLNNESDNFFVHKFIENNYPCKSISTAASSSSTSFTAAVAGGPSCNGSVGIVGDSNDCRIPYHHAGNIPSSSSCDSERTYENLETLRFQMQDCTDSASLHFESILEDDCNAAEVMQSPDVCNDFMFEIHKDHYEKSHANHMPTDDGFETDELRNLDIEKKKQEFSKRHPKYNQPINELADNALFNKIKETVESISSITKIGGRNVDGGNCDLSNSISTETAVTAVAVGGAAAAAATECDVIHEDIDTVDGINEATPRKLEDSNSVSCEDLLEFSDKKPKGRERGIESDEVRIMTKVLGQSSVPDQFILALDTIDWDVHKAIKLIMLQRAFASSSNLTLEQCVDELQKYDWDLHLTTIKLHSS